MCMDPTALADELTRTEIQLNKAIAHVSLLCITPPLDVSEWTDALLFAQEATRQRDAAESAVYAGLKETSHTQTS